MNTRELLETQLEVASIIDPEELEVLRKYTEAVVEILQKANSKWVKEHKKKEFNESFIIKDFNAVMRKCSIEIDELLNSGILPVTVRSSCGKSHRMDKFCGFYISLADNKR